DAGRAACGRAVVLPILTRAERCCGGCVREERARRAAVARWHDIIATGLALGYRGRGTVPHGERSRARRKAWDFDVESGAAVLVPSIDPVVQLDAIGIVYLDVGRVLCRV